MPTFSEIINSIQFYPLGVVINSEEGIGVLRESDDEVLLTHRGSRSAHTSVWKINPNPVDLSFPQILNQIDYWQSGARLISSEGIEVEKISNDELKITWAGITRTARRMPNPANQTGA